MNKLAFNLRRVRSSVRTDINTGASTNRCAQANGGAYTNQNSKICLKTTAQLCGRDSLDIENV